MAGIILPPKLFLCNNLTGNQVEHLRSIRVFAGELSEACISATNESIPFTYDRKIAGLLLGWSERVQPLRVKSLFRHRMWVDCDDFSLCDDYVRECSISFNALKSKYLVA